MAIWIATTKRGEEGAPGILESILSSQDGLVLTLGHLESRRDDEDFGDSSALGRKGLRDGGGSGWPWCVCVHVCM